MSLVVRVPVLVCPEGMVVIDFGISAFRHSPWAGGPCPACEGNGLVGAPGEEERCRSCGASGCDNVIPEPGIGEAEG